MHMRSVERRGAASAAAAAGGGGSGGGVYTGIYIYVANMIV